MGGLEISEEGQILRGDGSPIAGLYAAGEVAGGVHGNNRLGGNALLECVVFGRRTGAHAAKHIGLTTRRDTLHKIAGCYPGEEKAKPAAPAAAKPAAPPTAVVPAAPVGGGIPAGHYTMDEVAKHTTNTDVWVVINDEVLDVSGFLKDHPGGELAIMTFAGKDASEEFNMVHPPGVIEKYTPESKIGKLWKGAVPAAGEAPAAGGAVAGAVTALPEGHFTMDEVAKHTTNTDVWVVINDEVLDVSAFLKDHPGGELAIMTFAGKDASEEFNMVIIF